jgi:choline dehydrogenase-like flavoprotein
MRLTDTRRLGPDHQFETAHVCVVGAGAAGVYLAHRLAEQGCSVMLLEAGGKTCVDGETLGMGLDLGVSKYRGATLGRAFGLGGTTSRWGGQLVPYSESDVIRQDASARATWQHIVGTVQRHSARVREVLGVDGPSSAPMPRPFREVKAHVRELGLTVMASHWLPFHQRNLSRLLQASYPRGGRVEVLLHAVARSWVVSSSASGRSRISAVTIRSNGRDFQLRAPHFVIAAGTIESARILLEIQSAAPTDPFGCRSRIGRGLTDHLSSAIAEVPAASRSTVIEAFGPRFASGHMQSARLLESSPPPESARGFFHFVFDIENPGFHVARKAFAGLQARRLPEVSAGELVRGVSGLGALAWDRYVGRKLHVPADTAIRLQLDIEQVPSADYGVSLGKARDVHGRAVAEVDWSVSDTDVEQVSLATQRFVRAWVRRDGHLPELAFHPAAAPGELKPHDAYHPVGVCRLGNDDDAVVDPELRVRGTTNLWVLSTGIFPTAGTANPAFSMLCMGEQLASRLAGPVAS